MKLKNAAFLLAFVCLFFVACNNDSKSGDADTNENGVQISGDADSSWTGNGDSSIGSDGQPNNEANTGLMPQIKSSYYGKDPEGYEVTYNFLEGGKYEKFSFKNNQEKNEAGSYKKSENNTVELSAKDGSKTFLKSKGGNEYEVMPSGKAIYTVKEIN